VLLWIEYVLTWMYWLWIAVSKCLAYLVFVVAVIYLIYGIISVVKHEPR
jgi:hypothetical protein